MLKRVFLFLLTNLAVLALVSIVMAVFGIDPRTMTGLWIMAGLFGFGGAFISLWLSKWMAKRATGAQVIETPRTPEEAWLVERIREQSAKAGIAMPEVAIYDSPEPNAFATGPTRNNALVAVSTGLMRSMSREEVEAVLAHEVSHISNGDMVTMALIQGVLNTFVIALARIVGRMVDGYLGGDEEEGGGFGYMLTVIALEIVFGLFATLIVLWFSRRREFRADAGSAYLVGAPKMVSALRRLASFHEEQQQLPKSASVLAIHGRTGGGFARLWMSHPPLQERIAALENTRLV